jgi:hypothetical protein
MASQLTTDTTHILCPDKTCTLFQKPNCRCPCENDCPHQEKRKLFVVCEGCGKIIDATDTSLLQRVGHLCEGVGGPVASSFARVSGKYELHYELPKT